MIGKMEAYQRWAPYGKLWTEWVKPVSFSNAPMELGTTPDIPKLTWISQRDRSAAIILDLPAEAGVLEGMALAHIGYRPIPLYNGVFMPDGFFSMSAVQVGEIVKALWAFAPKLSKLRLEHDAPPAFLLDSNRMHAFHGRPGDYDNRWNVFPQDMPSASYMKGKGISSVVVRTQTIQDDLAHILYRYQSQGISIAISDGAKPKQLTLSKPSKFKSLFYRFGVILGLRRNATGGFGAKVPEPRGEGHYGYG